MPCTAWGWESCSNIDKQRRSANRGRLKTSAQAPAAQPALPANASKVPASKSPACECATSLTSAKVSCKNSKRRGGLAGHLHAAPPCVRVRVRELGFCAGPHESAHPDLALHVHGAGNRRNLVALSSCPRTPYAPIQAQGFWASSLVRPRSSIFRARVVAPCAATGCHRRKNKKGGGLHLPLQRAPAELTGPDCLASCAACDSRL